MPGDKKIFFVNDYSMQKAYALYKVGEYPGHHLWGLVELMGRGWDITFYPAPARLPIERLHPKFAIFSNLLFQLGVALRSMPFRRNFYFGAFSIFLVFGILRRFRLTRSRGIVLVHHPITSNKLRRLALAGADKVFFLTRDAMEKTLEFCPELAPRAVHVGWFVDGNFYKDVKPLASASTPLRIVAAGKELRDYDTLVAAINRLEPGTVSAKIYCSLETAPRQRSPDVDVHVGGSNKNAISYRELLKEYETCDVVIVPMKKVARTAGLTSIVDALACGRAVISTENPGIDVDIVGKGAGIVVAASDVVGLSDAIRSYSVNHGQCVTHGSNALQLANEELNKDLYVDLIERQFQDTFI